MKLPRNIDGADLVRTCLILGAGASRSYGYPLGSELADRFIEEGRNPHPALLGEDAIAETRKHFVDVAMRFEKSRCKQPAETIDQFLNTLDTENSKDREAYHHGLTLIAWIIRSCEIGNIENGWYDRLAAFVDSAHKSLSVVTFNYDRSLEFRLARHLARSLGLSTEEARIELENRVEILHVYGHVGRLPDGTPRDLAPEYGALRGLDAWTARTDIEIIGRGDATARHEQCTKAISAAERIVVLGFAYEETNCARIGLSALTGKTIFSTAFSDSDECRARNAFGGKKNLLQLGKRGEGCEEFLCRTKAFD